MTGKRKTRIRHLLFTALIMGLGIVCTGCFTAMTLDELGSTRSYIAGEHYEFSPDCDEIVLSCRKEEECYYIPFLHPFGVAPKKTVRTYEKHIPLNPAPDQLMCIELDVIPDASAARADKSPFTGAGGEFRALDEIMEFPTPAERLRGDADSSASPSILSAGNTLRLRVHPDDLPLLSGPFVACLLMPFDQVMREFYPEYRTVSDETAESESDHDRHERDATVHLLVFPYAQDGSRCQALTDADLGFYNLHPFSREYEAEAKQDNEHSTGFFGWCWKLFWVPPALIVDVALIPVYPFYMLYCVCSDKSVL